MSRQSAKHGEGEQFPSLCLNQTHTRMEQLKSFYIVINQLENRWGKGVTMREAMSSSGSPRTRFEIFQFILKEETPNDVVENLCHCYQVDAYGSVVFYEGKTPEWEKDKKQADEYIIGYTLIES